MGRHLPKNKTIKKDEPDEYDNQVDELYRPFLIHSTTYVLLTEQILSLMPSDRNVLLTMNEYDLSEINPMHPDTIDSPTHVIIFCIRFVAGNFFQPIGGLLIYKYKDQSVILAECLKAYINDLWKLGLYVVGTVSPPFESFKGMLSHLVDVKDFNTHTGSLVYSVAPIKEIVHIYDIQFLLIKLQNLFKEGDIKFVEVSKEYRASWNDISRVLNLSSEFKVLSNYLSDNKDVSRRVHIFTQQIFEQLLEFEAQGLLTKNAEGSAVLLNCIRSFLQYIELDLVDLNSICQVEGWSNFASILPSMTFQKSKTRTCTKTKPTVAHVINNSFVKRKINFHMEQSSEIVDNFTQNNDVLCEEPDEKFGNVCEISENCEQEKCYSDFVDSKKDCKKEVKHCKQKKAKVKESKKDDTVPENCNGKPKVKLHSKKPYDKQKIPIKKENTSEANEKTDFESKLRNTVKEDGDIDTKCVGNKLNSETEGFSEHICKKGSDQEEIDNKVNLNCDIDKNNNSDESLQSNEVFQNKSTTVKLKCDKTKSKRNKTNITALKEENFDIVINDAQKFFESLFIGYNSSTNGFNRNVEIFSNNFPSTGHNAETESHEIQGGISLDVLPNINSNHNIVEDRSDLCSEIDEIEKCVTKTCDNVPTIIESLSNKDHKNDSSDEFEPNDVVCDMLCTLCGMKKIMGNLIHRRVKVAKPDAFIVEHIDFLVTVIKRDKNNINPVYYYGHNYEFLNTELAFSTLENDVGLFLVKM